MGLGRKLRELGVRSRLGFFLHIPFPPPDIFAKLPWRVEILQSLLAYQVVGFQTQHDLDGFVACVRRYLPDAKRRHRQRRLVVSHEGEVTVCGAFPIGIDSADFEEAANSQAVAERVAKLRADVQGQQIVLGVDRLDYTKGIPHRLRALQLALKRHPELHRRMTMLQLVVPSRENVHEYKELRAQIEQLVSQINGEFAQPGWTPIQYLFRNLGREELVAYYRAADVALVTPLKDGMNLVAKEYCACQIDGNGVLILSEFAGAADQLDVGAILVNPFDFERVAESIKRAVLLPPAHRRPAMRRLRRNVRNFDVHWWVGRFFAAAGFADSIKRQPQGDVGRVNVA
jgi:trehalose 6-phosphate synthase